MTDIGNALFPMNNVLFDGIDLQSLHLGFESDFTSLSLNAFDLNNDSINNNSWTTMVEEQSGASNLSFQPMITDNFNLNLDSVGVSSFASFEHSSSTPDDSPPTSPSLSCKQQINVISPMEIFGMGEDNINMPMLEEKDIVYAREVSDASPSNSAGSDSSQSSPPSCSSKRKKEKDSSSSSTRPRKRQRKKEAHVPTALTLPRARLLTLSWNEFEKWVEQKKIEFGRELTAEEDKDIRRQRRLIKNRESAQYSREKRKNHLAELEAQVKKLSQENGDLNSKVRELTEENHSLKDQVRKLNNLLGQKKKNAPSSPTISSPSTSSSRSPLSKLFTINKPGIVSQSAGALASGTVYLLMILLSFGLIFNPIDQTRTCSAINGNNMPGKVLIQTLNELPDLVRDVPNTGREILNWKDMYPDPPEPNCVDYPKSFGEEGSPTFSTFEKGLYSNLSIPMSDTTGSKDNPILIDDLESSSPFIPTPPFGLVTGAVQNSSSI